MSAWQNPTDSCLHCGQDILLWPEVTPDVRMMYVRYCPHCDAGEPTGTPADRPQPMRLDADEIWGRSVRRERMFEGTPVPAADPGPAKGPAPVVAGQIGVDLWWDGDGSRKGIDARWARFAANGAERKLMADYAPLKKK